jgi:hypothetical protein
MVVIMVMLFNATFNNISVYHGFQFYWWRKLEYPEKTTDLLHTTDKTLSHNVESSAPHMSAIQTHNVSGDRY